ncbi:MAG: hypothetical protein Q8927_01460 [Bacteroidota bacterium]|nr:hypothetical protein [Bacteroidota bacterium]MDP4214837.1 hypothetical protein [Bacteroidota bacterium]MDP4247825.1 hypothetical protein [Bacteroidota bacterium]MDP4253139.1 hypothetical protein [Bacteroidota bacterium]MDP4259035.1 hypothetical protein [Bacteroidota bacterium]
MLGHNRGRTLLPEQIMRLDEDQRQDPMGVLEYCFDNYRLEEWKDLLREMLEVCLTTDNVEFAEAEQRAGLLQQCKELEGMVEAAWLLLRREREK